VAKRKLGPVKTASHGHEVKSFVGQAVAGNLNGLDQDVMMAEVWEEEKRHFQNVMACDWR
jgi:hypothetical protein